MSGNQEPTQAARHQQFAEARNAYSAGDIDRAAALCDGLLKQDGSYADVLHLRAEIYKRHGDLDKARAAGALAVKHAPDNAVCQNSLGLTFYGLGQLDEAAASFERACSLDPALASAWSNKAKADLDRSRFFEAKAAFERALKLQPNNLDAIVNLAVVWGRIGRIKEAKILMDRAEALNPASTEIKRTRLRLLNYDADATEADALRQAKSLWHPAGKVKAWRGRVHSPDAMAAEKEKLKIGYVSADFSSHPVGRLILPVLASHNRDKVSITVYSDLKHGDEVTRSIQETCDFWRPIAGLSDDDVISQIEKDEIDILIDLAGHTHGNRLKVFLNKPAPVQMSWLGYCGPTGLVEMDYMLVDRHAVKPGEETHYTETPLFLPDTLLCYTGPGFAGAVQPPPCIKSDQVTFGSFNNPSKINERVAHLWAKIIDAIPNSKLVVKYHTLSDRFAMETVVQQFEENGIAAEKLILLGNTPAEAHLAAYNKVDIALDPFPYNGTMTTLDALWMGVPVVNLDGDRWVARMTAGLLKTIGLPELVAHTESEYVDIAASLARSPERLSDLRREMRQRITASPLCDTEGFTRSLESLLRQAWHAWCRSAR
jgi:protein O-GlcNAc transferase